MSNKNRSISQKNKNDKNKVTQFKTQDVNNYRRVPMSLDNIRIPLELINSSSPEHIFISDKDGRFTYVSPAGARTIGLNPNDIIGRTWDELGFPKGFEPFDAQRETVFVTGQPMAGETSFPTNEGKKSYEYILSPIFDIDNSVEAVECLVRDVTERKRVTRAIQDARKYSENLMETVHEPILVLDADMRVIRANRSFYQTFKTTPDKTEWKFIYELADSYWNIPLLRKFLEQFLTKNISYDNFEITQDFPKVGQKITLVNARKIYREFNKSQEIVLAIEDVTECKQVEKTWLETEEWLSTTLRSIREAFIATDENGTVKFMNPIAEEMTGWLQDDAIGKPLEIIFNIPKGQSYDYLDEIERKTLGKGEKVWLLENIFLTRKDGMKLPINGNCTAVKNDAEEIIGSVLVFQNLIKSKK